MGTIIGWNSPKNEKQNPTNTIYNMETSNSTRSNVSAQQNQIENNVVILCSRCKKSITNNDFNLQNCGQNQCIVKFHEKCFFKELNDQNTKKEVLEYKCVCGTKIPSKMIRKCEAPNLIELLSSIHRRQLDHILTNSYLRKNHEILSFCSENKQKKHEQDYFLLEQDQLVHDETPF